MDWLLDRVYRWVMQWCWNRKHKGAKEEAA